MSKEAMTLYTLCGHQVRVEPSKTHFWKQPAKRAAPDKIEDYCLDCKPILKTSLPVPKDTEVASPIFKPAKAESLVSRFLRRSVVDQEASETKAREKRAAREKKAAAKSQAEAESRECKKQQKKKRGLDNILSESDYEPFSFPDEATFNMLMGAFNPLQDDDDYEVYQRAKEMCKQEEAARMKAVEESRRSDLQEPYPDGKMYTALP